MPSHATREFLRAPSRSALWVSAALAVTAHAAVLFMWNVAPGEARVMEVGGGEGMEVALVEPESGGEEESAPTAAVMPPVPEAMPNPVLEAPIPPPEPESPSQTEKLPAPEADRSSETAASTSNAPVSASTPAPRSSRGSASPGEKRSSGRGSGSVGAGAGVGKPAFLIRPSPVYPPESRTAGESGVVLLHITTNAGGRPTSVDLAKSSGFPRLDRAAIEAAWRCRISNASPGAVFEAPVRFRLQR